MNGSASPSPAKASFVIENGKHFSASVLWQLQRAYYQQLGVTAWNQGSVPHYITNNPVIAGAYAQVVTGFLRDCLRQPVAAQASAVLDPAVPIYILEPGAGSGRFAYHFLKRLLPMLEQPALRGLRIVYVLTDMVERNVEFWRQHPKLKPFFQSGHLDVALFDAIHDSQVHLLNSGVTLAPGDIRNPLIVLANYFFCAIPMDIFSVDQGLLREELVSIVSTNSQIARNDPAVLPYLSIHLTPRFAPADYYSEAEDNQLLRDYVQLLSRAYVSFPHSALGCLRNLARLAGDRMLLLTGDRGFYRQEDLRTLEEPRLSLHGNSVSMPVNFHALGEFFARRGGQVYFSQHREEGLVIAACTLGNFQEGTIDTSLLFQEAIEHGGPDDFFQLKKAVEGSYDHFSLDQLLAFLRISGYDENIFSASAASLLRLAENATEMQQEQLYRVLCRVWEMYYPIGEPQNIPEKLARLFITISCYREALDCLHWSVKLYGNSDATQQLMDECQKHIWNFEDVSLDQEQNSVQ